MELDAFAYSPDARWTFRIYAIVAGAAGLLLFGWGPMWLGVDLPGLPFYRASFVRVTGGVLILVACLAAGFDRVEDPDARRFALLWFGLGHGALFLVLASQQAPIWNSPLVDKIMTVVLLATFTFFYLRSGAEPGPPPNAGLTLLSISGTQAPAREITQSRYQRQIREAASQEERHRLARDLHDSVKQQIFAIQTSAAAAQVRFDSDPAGARAALDQVRVSSREAMAEMEAMLDQLRAAPLENAGLVASLKQQCEALGFRTGAKVEFEVGALPDNFALSPGAQEALFRVAQEALANVARHARAAHVHVALFAAQERLTLTIDDDGCGFDPAQPGRGMGVANMRGRAAEFGGTFDLASAPAGGTRVSVSVPFSSTNDIAAYTRRMAWYAAAVVFHFAVAVWRGSSVFATMGVLFTVYFVRTAALRTAARRNLEAVR